MILPLILKENIKILLEYYFLLVLVLSLRPLSYLKERYFLKPSSIN
jgi:hypothetical protein